MAIHDDGMNHPDSSLIYNPQPASDAISVPPPKRKTKRLACAACRQAKLKCIGAGNFSGCEHCQKKGVKCEVKPDYKRVSHSSKLNQLSGEVRRLRDLLASSTAAGPRPPHPAGHGLQFSTRSQPELETGHHTGSPLQVHQLSAATSSPADTRAPTPRLVSTPDDLFYSLGPVCLKSEQVEKLFQIFFLHFHPHFPILNIDITSYEYHERSPLLFWSIIVVAARNYRDQPDLRTNLSNHVKDLLWAKTISTPPSHFTIQAQLLMCVWPFSPPTLIEDPTIFIASMARTGCIQLGIHQPENMQDFNRIRFDIHDTHIQEALKIWAGCFVAAESVTSAYGHESIFRANDLVLGQATQMTVLPETLRRILRVDLILNRLFSTINDAVSSMGKRAECGPLILSFEHELSQLETDLSLGNEAAIWLLAARLQIQVLHFLDPPTSALRKPGLLRAFATAVGFIRLLHTANMQPGFNRSPPHYFGQLLKLAVLVMLRLYSSNYSVFLDEEQVNHHFDLALSLHQSMIVDKNDFHEHATILLPDLRRIFGQDMVMQSSEPYLQVKTRQSASLLHDCHWIWRDYYAARSVDTQRLGRPPRELPSLIQYSPSSAQATGSSVVHEHSPVNLSPQRPNNSTGDSKSRSAVPEEAVGQSTGQSTPYTTQQQEPQQQQHTVPDESMLDPLDMMYAFLDPCDESSALFYPSWSVDGDL